MPARPSDPLAAFLGFALQSDETVPPGEIHVRNSDGSLAARLVNVAEGDAPPPALGRIGLARARLRGAMTGVLSEVGTAEARRLFQEDLLVVLREWRDSGHDMGGWIV